MREPVLRTGGGPEGPVGVKWTVCRTGGKSCGAGGPERVE